MRFLIDMPLPPALAAWLRSEGHEASHAADAGLAQASDSVVLDYARSKGQVIITADLDYPRLLALTYESRIGLILFRGGEYSEAEALRLLQWLLEGIPEAELMGGILVIERTRILENPPALEISGRR